MELLKPPYGAVKSKKRKGRGPGSGKGKTAGRGGKGQTARKGGGVRIGFEGGQTPLYRRLPKRGFVNGKFKVVYNEINLHLLNRFEDGAKLSFVNFVKAGLIANEKNGVKILGNGTLNKKLEIQADKFSKNAKEKIEKSGGKVIEIGKVN
jgi:large subunit ribosomal protein L15